MPAHALFPRADLLIPGAPGPRHLSLEVTNLCNANCTFCAYQHQTRPVQFMPMDVFTRAIDQFSRAGGGEIGLTPVVGDALIDPELAKKIAYARNKTNITVIGLTTNAILLKRELFDQLVNAGLDHLDVSMSGFNRKEYKRVYRNDSYVKVRQNLINVARSTAFSRCLVRISVRTDSWFPKLRADYRLFKRMGYSIWGTSFYDNWSGRIRNRDLSGAMLIRPNRSKKLPCRMLYSGPTVLSNGTITACGCRDLNGDSELVVGHLKSQTISQAWEDGTMGKLRQRFLDGNLPDICRDCRHYNPVEAADVASELQEPIEEFRKKAA